MSARSTAIPHVRDARFILGVAAFLIGTGIYVSGLYGLNGTDGIALSAIPQARTALGDHRWDRAISGVEARPMTYARHETLRTGGLDERLPFDAPVAPDPSDVAKATAQWTADWYRAVSSDGVRAYLASSSSRWATRWSRAILSWDDTSGYGAVEASRATMAARVDGLASSDPGVDAARGPSRDGIGSTVSACNESASCPRQHEPRTWLLQSSSWSREHRESGVRSSSLIWTTPTLVGADLTGAATRP